MLINKNLSVIKVVAAKYWQTDPETVGKLANTIQVIKQTGGKVMGILPCFNEKPSVFFKIYFYDRGFRFESEGVQAANEIAPINGIKVPTVIKILPEYKAILTERRSWMEDFSDIQRLFIQTLNIDWRNLGRWLRSFHESKISQEVNHYFIRKKTEKIQSHMKSLESHFTEDHTEEMNRIIQEAHQAFVSHNTHWVISHGDFGLANIKFFENQLEIIDFEDCQMAPRSYDILNFLVRLSYLRGFPHAPGTYQQIVDQFMEGYGVEIHSSPIDNFLFLLIKLDMIETYHRRKFKNKHNIINKTKFGYFFNRNQKHLKKGLLTSSNKSDEKSSYFS